MIDAVSEDEKKTIRKWKKMMAGGGVGDAKRLVWRVRTIDGIVEDFISKNPSYTVISVNVTDYLSKKSCIVSHINV